MRKMSLFLTLALLGCDQAPPDDTEAAIAPAEYAPAAQPTGSDPGENASKRLDEVLASRPGDVQARDAHRHPKETLEFFGIEPGMTVVEALPGGGWYSQVLVPYLGNGGRLIGANYDMEMWPKLGFSDQEFIASMRTWPADWPGQAEAWRGNDGAAVEAFEFGSLPKAMEGQADAVLFIRALHNLARLEDDGGYLTTALGEANRVLKPGGIVGVVQHEARPDKSDEWASGDNGYLKKQFVIDRLTEAGFEFVEESGINENEKDQPSDADVVWRLPPSYRTSGDDPQLRADMDDIGESHRMTLKFRKPGG
jgi:predicted methyltransferase